MNIDLLKHCKWWKSKLYWCVFLQLKKFCSAFVTPCSYNYQRSNFNGENGFSWWQKLILILSIMKTLLLFTALHVFFWMHHRLNSLRMKTGVGITIAIASKLNRNWLNLSDCRSQSYDNQSTFGVIHSGVLTIWVH